MLLESLLREIRTVGKELGFKGRGSFLVKEDNLLRAIRVDVMQKGRVSGSAGS